MKFCTECGSKLDGKVNFCSDCGAKIISDSQKVVEVAKAVTKQPSKVETNEQLRGNVSSNVRVMPLYGVGFKIGVHCFNCGSKLSQSKICQVCGAEQ